MNKDEIGYKFLLQCKQNYFDNIFPANKLYYEKEEYKRIVTLAQDFFKYKGNQEFAGFFMEAQYLVNLWTAHMLLEYGNPSNDLIIESLKIIVRYSLNTLKINLANQEKEWLEENKEKYQEYIKNIV